MCNYLQGVSETTNPLQQLPGVISKTVLNEVLDVLPENSKSLAKLLQLSEALWMERLRNKIAPEFRAQFTATLRNLPLLEVNLSISKIFSEAKSSDSDVDILCLNTRWKYEIRLGIKCNRGDPNFRVYAPRFHRSKIVSWWIVIVDTSKDILLAIKRTELREKFTTVSLFIELSSESLRGIRLAVIADSVMDIDSTVNVAETLFNI
jgi:hypothetical protein